jgi:hypothetical protein
MILIETAIELFDFIEGKIEDCDEVFPCDARLVFENEMGTVRLENTNNKFVLCNSIDAERVLIEAVKRHGIQVHVS